MGGGWSTPRPGRFTPGKDPDTHCIGGWVGSRAGLDGCEHFAPTGIRSPDRPARSELLYRLRYPGPPSGESNKQNWDSSDCLFPRKPFRLPLWVHVPRFVSRSLGLTVWVQNMARRLRVSASVVVQCDDRVTGSKDLVSNRPCTGYLFNRTVAL